MRAFHHAALLLLALLAASGCRSPVTDRNGDGKVTMLCIGDSNTDPGYTPTEPSWCDLTGQAYPQWRTVNGAVIMARVRGDCLLCGKLLMKSGLDYAKPDLVFISLGTNDFLSYHEQPEPVVADLLALRDQAAATNAEVLITTIPPLMKDKGEVNARIKAANALLAERVAANRLVDFTSDMGAEDFLPDGIHVSLKGQQKRAAAALRCLKRL